MPHLTKTVVEAAAAPKAGQTFIRDDEIKGFALRMIAAGGKSFVFEGRIKGRMRRVTIGRYPDVTVATARQKALEIRAAIGRGDDPAEARILQKHESTFGALAERYLRDYALPYKKPRSVADDKYYLAHYIPSGWQTRRLSDITRTDIEQLHSRVERDHGKYPANHAVRLLRHMFNLARDWKMLRNDNPAARIKLFKEQRRERYLTPEELVNVNEALKDEPDWRWRAYFPLALMLGTRRGELCAVRWEDIDLQQRTMRLPETKAGRPHLLPLPRAAIAILESSPSRTKSGWVFPSESSAGHIVEPAKAWQRIRKRAGVEDVRIHDLRHTLASWLVGAGYNLSLIGRALNHSQIATTERYAHLAMDPVREALERNADLMFGAKPVSERKKDDEQP
ncbi:MAG: tyrosine-type recombinase/integrase [Deltaproteobacteria bacterium]|nr:tyrosine-type recombinase/integrase [Deltaproteobacteria bacterium]